MERRSPLYKESKTRVAYTDRAMIRSERCELCRHFVEPKACEIVEGRIAPEGWCKRFERK